MVLKDVDWFLWVECLWAKCLHSSLVIAPYPYLDRYCIRLFSTLTRAFKTCQMPYIFQWGTPKGLESSLILHLADIVFNMIKWTFGQALNEYKLKCPRGVGLGSFPDLNLGPI